MKQLVFSPSLGFFSNLPSPSIGGNSGFNEWYFTSPLKTSAHRSAGGGEACLSVGYLPLPLCNHITLTWPSIFWHLPPSRSVFVCQSACVCRASSCRAAMYLPGWKHQRFPSNRPWKLSVAAEISCSKTSVWSCVIEKRSRRKRQKVCLAFSSQLIAGDVSEDNRWQLCNPLNLTSKDDKMVSAVWQFDRLKWAAAIRRGLSLIWNSKSVCRNSLLLNIKLLQKKLFYDTDLTNWKFFSDQWPALI